MNDLSKKVIHKVQLYNGEDCLLLDQRADKLKRNFYYIFSKSNHLTNLDTLFFTH
jgi:hypothetical protein